MLAWFKKRKRASKQEEPVIVESDESQQQSGKKSSSRKKKNKDLVVVTSEISMTPVEQEKEATKADEKKQKKSRSSRPKPARRQSSQASRDEIDKGQSEMPEDPEEQQPEIAEQVSFGTEEEAENDVCGQDDYYEEASESNHGDFVGDYEFGEEGMDDAANFACLSPADIVKEQTRMIKEVAELLVVTDTVAGNLLRHFKWREERLLAAYFENPKAVLREIGQTVPKRSKSKTSRKHTHTHHTSNGGSSSAASTAGLTAKLEGSVECLICADDLDASECTALTCDHAFCNSCWADYLTMKITEGAVEKLTCPGLNCKNIVPDQVVATLVTGAVYDKYVRFITKSFVESNAKCTWCPAPNCGNAITAEMLQEGTTVQCSCGYAFCFSCHNEAHAPATCEHVRIWAQKCRDDSETTHWLGANTKECPKCKVAVEKNGGCMHMTCRHCTHEWCWLCSRPWKGHNDYYSCNRYEKAQKKDAKDAKKKNKLAKLEEERELQRQQLTRYLHYYERYLSHDAASKMDKQIKDKAYQKMAELEGHATRTEVSFIERASEMLIKCHATLKWSYVYAYQLPEDGSQKHLFNYLQQELEKTTEKLAELLEAPSSIMPLKRLEAVDLTALAATKRTNLLKGVVHDEYVATN